MAAPVWRQDLSGVEHAYSWPVVSFYAAGAGCGRRQTNVMAQAAKDGLRNLSPRLLGLGAGFHFEGACVESSQGRRIGERTPRPCRAQQPYKFRLHRGGDAMAIARSKAVQNEFFDMQVYTHPAVSWSASGRSIFMNSLRAAESRCSIRTGSPASAARKAAPMAMF